MGRRGALAAPILLLAAAAPISTAASSTLLAATILVWAAARLARRIPSEPGILWFEWAVLAWALGQAISAIVHGDPAALGGVAARTSVALLVFAAKDLLVPFETVGKRALLLFLAALTLAAGYAAFTHLQGADLVRARPLEPDGATFVATGFFGHPLTLGGALAIGFLLATGVAITASRAKGFWLAVPASGVIAYGLFASQARSAWAGAFAGLLSIGFLLGRRAIGKVFLFLLAAGIALAALRPGIFETVGAAFTGGNGGTPARELLLRTSLRMFADQPLLGIGPGNFEERFPEYRVSGVYESTAHPHNDFVRALLEGGVLSGLGYLGILFLPLLPLIARTRRSRDSLARGIAAGAFGACVALWVGGFFQTYLADFEVALSFFLVLGMALAATAPEGNTPNVEELDPKPIAHPSVRA